MKLTAAKVKAIKSGRHADGGGLYLDASGQKSWIFRYQMNGRSRWMGLGQYPAVSLSEARQKAAEARSLKSQGIDPLEQKARGEADTRFLAVAEELIESKRDGWRKVTTEEWERALRLYTTDLNPMRCEDITTQDILNCLKPIWKSQPTTAKKTRSKIEAVIGASIALGYRSTENPARWRNHLDQLLLQTSEQQHHVAMPYEQIPEFYATLGDSVAELALRFLIVTAVRSQEARKAVWSEIDGDTWEIPGERMKVGKAHRVPLSTEAQRILELVPRGTTFIFPGQKWGDQPQFPGPSIEAIR